MNSIYKLIVTFYLDIDTEGATFSLDNPDLGGEMQANSSFTTFQDPAAGDAFDPSIFARTAPNPSQPLRRVLDRSRLWNQRYQQGAYQFNLHDRVERVISAWQNNEPEYGSLHQLAKDLDEISAIHEPADIEAAMPANMEPTTANTPVDADNSLDAAAMPSPAAQTQGVSKV